VMVTEGDGSGHPYVRDQLIREWRAVKVAYFPKSETSGSQRPSTFGPKCPDQPSIAGEAEAALRDNPAVLFAQLQFCAARALV
jgi:hypothetical protein